MRRQTGRVKVAGIAALVAIVALAVLALSGSASARINGTVVPDAETTKEAKVTKQPTSKTVEDGESVSFESTASGTPTPSVQWEVSTNGGSTWEQIPGATTTQLTIESAKTSEGGDEFRAVFTNGVGKPAISKEATLTVRAIPVVTEQPKSVAVEEGQSALFKATASGAPAPTVQWQQSTTGGSSWTSIKEATSEQLTIVNTTTSLSGREYRAVFTNAVGKTDSEAATLTVQKAPAVTTQPSSVAVTAGEPANFEATASGFPTPSVQWEVSTDGGSNWSPVSGATDDKLTIAETQGGEDGYLYRAVFSNAAGSATSAAATLTVHSPPVITEQPSSTTVEVGENATFEATASGFTEPTVQWELSSNDGSSWSAITAATSDRLTIEATTTAENGDEYRAVFTNMGGTTSTNAVTLTVATTRYGALAWGNNLSRQLGDGSAADFSDVPVPVSGLDFVTAVAAGGSHSLALLANGHVMAWGSNVYGQLGDGTSNTPSTPVEVQGLSGVTAIAAGENHSLALLSNGTVMAWGDNEEGQVGNGKAESEQEAGEELPVPVNGLTNVKAIAAGGNHSLALLSNDTVMAWGENAEGELGNGSRADAHSPVLVKDLTGVTAIAAGGNFSLALTSKETVQAWGSDANGQLAHSAAAEEELSKVPVVAEGLTGVTRIAAGASHALALLGNGTVEAWGRNNYGELGDGKVAASQETPVQVNGLEDVTAISAGTGDSLAVLGSGSVMSFGTNAWGQLGNGTAGDFSDVPVEVAGVREVASISAGGAHTVAFGEPIPVVTGLSSVSGPAGGGTIVKISGDTFTGATKVTFGSAEATNVVVESATSITATAPAGSGTVNVEVTTPAGTSVPAAANSYTYVQPPAVKKLSAKSGPVGGETSVIITGTEFIGVTAVHFGEAEAESFTVTSPTSITVVSPLGAPGMVDVMVTAAGGSSAKVNADHFKYTPTVEQVTPNEGSTAGGTPVTVTGTGFALGATATQFKFGKTKAKVTSVACASSTTCTMTAPAHVAEAVNVTATVNKEVSPTSAADEFTYR